VPPGPLYGVTADGVSGLGELAASDRHLARMPVTRVYFDVRRPAGYYTAAVARLRPVSYLMGELLDSADETRISVPAFRQRVASYLHTLGGRVDIWEIGNEVNGNWLGPHPAVAARLAQAYRAVSAAGHPTALTLYYNAHCGDGPAELSPLAFSRRYVPRAVRDGLTYVLLSYYEADCRHIRPSAATWTSYFRRLHALYPRARLGFGETGMNSPASGRTLAQARSLIRYYYGLRITLPYYVGGYFWWYYRQDCLPYQARPLWHALDAGFRREAAALRGHRTAS
jgi:hypothetical protein